MNTSFTPGPWRISIGILHPAGKIGDTKSNDIRVYAPPDNESRWVADCGHFYSKEQQANARLIAASPDLLSALVQAKAWMIVESIGELSQHDQDVWHFTIEFINQAINKATGQEP